MFIAKFIYAYIVWNIKFFIHKYVETMKPAQRDTCNVFFLQFKYIISLIKINN